LEKRKSVINAFLRTYWEKANSTLFHFI
jgi:hypothetical protein